MTTYQPLMTEKFWHEALKEEVQHAKRARSRNAIQSFFIFLFGLAVIGGIHVSNQQTNWIPQAFDVIKMAALNIY